MSFDTLYVNGCSFTAGDSLPINESWPSILQGLTGYNLINDSKNGNSFDTISLVSTCQLVDLDPEKTLVIIGLTWAERYGILYDQFMVNITPADIGENKSVYTEKLGHDRRVSSPLIESKFEFLSARKEFVDDENKFKGFNTTMRAFSNFYECLVEYDSYLKTNQYLNYLKQVLQLQSFLEVRKFKYLMIDFPGYFFADQFKRDNRNSKLFDKIDKDKIIDMRWDRFAEYIPKTSHPDSDQCKIIANLINERL